MPNTDNRDNPHKAEYTLQELRAHSGQHLGVKRHERTYYYD